LHLTESFVVTPLLAGRRLALDPIMIFLSLLLFGWMWGIAGLLIAVPLLTCLKIIALRVPSWATLAKLLGA
jgi:predicted PurR-regulated permease PerM